MLASYDKLVKYLAERIQTALTPLDRISQNQEIIIAQNKQIIDLLAQLNGDRIGSKAEQTDSDSPPDSGSQSEPSASIIEQDSPDESSN